MKEYIETIQDSFIDYAGKEHHFTIAAISELLPKNLKQLENNPDKEDRNVYYEVGVYIEDYGADDYVCNLEKCLKLGISICNPEDKFDPEIGKFKAIARAKNSTPVIFAKNSGLINTEMVKGLLSQEAKYLKNNPENYIKGYKESKDRYLLNQEMNKLKSEFSNTENEVLNGLKENPKFLDKVMKYLKWSNNQSNGKKN